MASRAGHLNGQLAVSAAQAQRALPVLANGYQRALAILSADFEAKLRLRGRVLTASADWPLPNSDELYDLVAAHSLLERAGERKRIQLLKTVMQGTMVSHGISWDVKNPAVQGVLQNQLGRHIVAITEDHRAKLMGTLEQAWSDGLSIPNAVKAIQSTARVDNAMRAARIARTEINTAVNGGALAAAKMVGVAPSKSWLATNDSRTRPDHGDVDGEVVPLGAEFMVGGYPMQHPGDQNAPPEETVNCRCTMLFVD